MKQSIETPTLIWRLHAHELMLIKHSDSQTALLGLDIVTAWFTHTPPNSYDIEYAIQLVEDALYPLKSCIQLDDLCCSDDEMVLFLCQKLQVHDKILRRDQVELYFDHVMQSLNRPMELTHLAISHHEIAYLLVLREAMHHLNFFELHYTELTSFNKNLIMG